jgi:hypothetical protein
MDNFNHFQQLLHHMDNYFNRLSDSYNTWIISDCMGMVLIPTQLGNKRDLMMSGPASLAATCISFIKFCKKNFLLT